MACSSVNRTKKNCRKHYVNKYFNNEILVVYGIMFIVLSLCSPSDRKMIVCQCEFVLPFHS